MLYSTYTNALVNFQELHQKVAQQRHVVVLRGAEGEHVVWLSLTDFLEQNGRVPSADEILTELLA